VHQNVSTSFLSPVVTEVGDVQQLLTSFHVPGTAFTLVQALVPMK
jgi:hypothetical protein